MTYLNHIMTKPLIYPVIITELTDNSGHYFTIDSPNIPGMHTDGDDLEEAVLNAVDAIATMLDGKAKADYPQPVDPRGWKIKNNQFVSFITIDMVQWQIEKARALKKQTVRRTITIPGYLNDLARERKINVSQVATKALKDVLK